MKKFMALFFGSAESMHKWSGLDEKTRQTREKEGLQAWHNWVKTNEKRISVRRSARQSGSIPRESPTRKTISRRSRWWKLKLTMRRLSFS